MRHLLLLLVSLVVLVAPSHAQDIVIISLDDWGRRDSAFFAEMEFAVHDAPPMPAVDSLAVQGVAFTRAWSNPTCSPTRYSILFGKYPSRGGILSKVSPACGLPSVDLAEVSMPELIGPSGYATSAIGKWHLSSGLYLPNCFAGNAPRRHGFDTGIANTMYTLGTGYKNWSRFDDGVSSTEPLYNTRVIGDEFIEWWEATPSPKLAYVALNAPHKPFHEPPPGLLNGYDGGPGDRGLYKEALVAADNKLSQMLDVIDLQTTTVFLFGDNGTPDDVAIPEQDPTHMKGSVYEEGIGVPFIVAGQSIVNRGRVCDALIGVVDILATCLEITNVDCSGAYEDGYSFLPYLQDEQLAEPVRRWIFAERTNRQAIRGTRYKYVRDQGVEAFYDLLNDPDEISDISGSMTAQQTYVFDRMAETVDNIIGA